MEIREVDSSTYREIIPGPFHIFNSADFSTLNREKAESVHFLLFRDGKYRLGLTAGIRAQVLYSPFSAPFGGFSYLKNDIRISYIDQAVETLIEWSREKKLKEISLSLPPGIYEPGFISKQTNSFFRNGFAISKIDLSYSFNTKDFDHAYTERIWRNARKNINAALKQDLKLFKCSTVQDHQLAYEIISKNRARKGFPLRMSWDQLHETTRLIQADSFLVRNVNGEPVASAIIFHVADRIVQVIYWGDIPDPASGRAMNFLAYKVFEYYREQDVDVIDLGPSTENSIPNPGLCEFKESLGCEIQPKFTFSRNI